ncbi:MAG: type II CRISPR-associated endonuclease Cas1 [Fastidiosipilaceae bacterium]|jgi:CRISPR-associated protein Cas1
MSWRTVCITKRAKLEYRMGAMVVRGEDTVRVHLSEMAVLIVESTAVSITTSLLLELAKAKIKVIFCDDQHNPYGELITHRDSHNSSETIRNQIIWTPEIKDYVWMLIIREKIKLQAQHLEIANREEWVILESYLHQVLPADPSNREGHAAKVYFNALFGKDFSRDRDCTINAGLNYGYGLVLSSVNKAVTAAGRLTQIGIWHDNMYNAFNFSCDLMEPFRPFVDIYVRKVLNNQMDFNAEVKHQMLLFLETNVLFEGQKQKVGNAIRMYVTRVIQLLDENKKDKLPDLALCTDL